MLRTKKNRRVFTCTAYHFSRSLTLNVYFFAPACEMEEDLSGEDSAPAAPPCRDSVLTLLLRVVGVQGDWRVYQQEEQENRD